MKGKADTNRKLFEWEKRTDNEKVLFWPYNESFIDEAYSVKIAGHWPCEFFVFLLTLFLSQSSNENTKKELGQYSAIDLTLGH